MPDRPAVSDVPAADATDASVDRRAFIAGAAGSVVAASGLTSVATAVVQPEPATAPAPGLGRLRQSVCRWCYGSIPTADLCRAAADMGLESVEILGENEWHLPKEAGITCAVANGPGGISVGWNRPDQHDRLVAESERLLPLIAEAGLPQMIVFSGNREAGLDDDTGLANCAEGLKRIMPLAEDLGVRVIMELLNSKRDHRGYMCDRTPWGVELVQRVESDQFRLLYDIYHMQIMEGDVIATIREHGQWIAHYHTGGVPGRREIDDSQELFYPAICRAIADTGYDGFLGQEFIPSRDPLASLRQAVEICTV